MIAKALVQECPLILLDEPTAFLDVVPDEKLLPLSLCKCEGQLVGSYLKITVYHHFVGFVMKAYHGSKIPAKRFLR